jgi:hypothetical protein
MDAEGLSERPLTDSQRCSSPDVPNLIRRELWAVPTPDVLGARHWFKMVGTHTRPAPAQMIQVEALRDHPDISV